MPINLHKSMSWMNADADETKMLDALQGNILKGHGRQVTTNIFFRIDPTKKTAMRAAIRKIATERVMSAHQQLLEAKRLSDGGAPGGVFVSFYLSKTGYEALGVQPSAIPQDHSFRAGMKSANLGDKDVVHWDEAFRGQIDGMVLVGVPDANTPIAPFRKQIVDLLTQAGGTILKVQNGKALFEDGNGIEHFGYVDGRSQPLVLLEDLVSEENDGGIATWNPGAPLDVALVADPAANDRYSFGSYFIFRKLEQNVRGFKTREQELADALGLDGTYRELAGALVVGRFENGTPVTKSDVVIGAKPPNDFDYSDDPGLRCPYQAHIRKSNPRGSGGAEALSAERKHLMMRRGIPYEDVPRAMAPKDLPDVTTFAKFREIVAPLLPEGGVGLLFMAYNRDISAQFEFTQKLWVNNNAFPEAGVPPLLDPIIGQPVGQEAEQLWPRKWNDAGGGVTPFSFADFVTMRGGEYFFAPSLTFLKSL